MDYVALFYCLSNLKKPESYVDFFQQNEKFIVGDVKVAVSFYLDYYRQHKSFPDFPTVVNSLGIDVSGFSLENIAMYYGSSETATGILWEKFQREISSIELRSLESQLITEVNEEAKKKILAEYTRKVVSGSVDLTEVVTRDTDISMQQDAHLNNPDGLVFPLAKMTEEYGSLPLGHSLTILAPPGAFKTTAALNIVFLNSVARDKRCLYIFLEDVVKDYQKKIFSRFTLAYSGINKIHKDVLLRGTDDPGVKAIIAEEEARYIEMRKGAIYYTNLSGISKEPLYFVQQLAKIINEYNIDYVVVDHVQKLGAFVPPRMNKYEYMNQMVSNISACALGQFNSRVFSPIFLSQMTKETIKKGNKTEGRFEVSDCAEVAALERDSVYIMSLWTNDQLKAAGEVKYQLLKARNGITVSDPIKTYVQPEYSYFGDVTGLQDVYSPMALHDNFATSDFARELDL